MQLCQRLEQILEQLRPAFNREATFQWFILLLWGVMLNSQPAAITSYVNAIGLTEGYYHQALHWFNSKGFSAKKLSLQWSKWLSSHENAYKIRGKRVYVGDGIKVGKEGRKMPGVKKLHQESEDVSKPEWIRGHYFSALSQLVGTKKSCFAVPLRLKIHDGIKSKPTPNPEKKGKGKKSKTTLVTKMADLCATHATEGSYVILDAYYACKELIKRFRQKSLHLITRVRCSTVAYAPFCPVPTVKGRGRPRRWGDSIKLETLFSLSENFQEASLQLYGRRTRVFYQCVEFFWDSPDEPVQFVLTQFPNGRRLILLCTNLELSGPEIISAYSLRFKIEVMFRQLIHLLGGFAYHFWLKGLPSLPTWPSNLILSDYPQDVQTQILAKVEAFERFVTLNAIALGLLQILSLELPKVIWQHFPRWFRTLPSHGAPSERVALLALQDQAQVIFPQSPPCLLFPKLLASKLATKPTPLLYPDIGDLAA
jgi:hypothetical protein